MPCAIETLQSRLKLLQGETGTLLAKPADQRTDADRKRIGELPAAIKAAKADLAAEQELESASGDLTNLLDKPATGQSLRNSAGNPAAKAGKTQSGTIEIGQSEAEKRTNTGGFKSLGHLQYLMIQASNAGGKSRDPQAVKAIAEWQHLSGQLEMADDDYGDQESAEVRAVKATKAASGLGITGDPTADIFVPMEFSRKIFTRMEGLSSDLASKCSRMPLRGSSIRIPAWNDANRNESYRAGGVVAYWEGEGDDLTPTTPNKTRWKEFRLKRLTAGVYVSDELMEDSAGAVDAYVNKFATEALSFKLNQAIWEGNGAGKPNGAFRSAAKVMVSKEFGQSVATVVAKNIDKMWSRFTAGYRAGAVWHINQDIEEQLAGLYYSTGANSGQLVYSPPGGLHERPNGMIKGRPVEPIEFCETLGTEGDIVLVNWSQVMLVMKGETDRDVSMHVKFLSHQQTFRYSLRADSDHMWDAPVTPLKGNNTTSCLVSLETRS